MTRKVQQAARSSVAQALALVFLAVGCQEEVADPTLGDDQGFLSDSTPIDQLTDAQRVAWCRWYQTVIPSGLGNPQCYEYLDQIHYGGFAQCGRVDQNNSGYVGNRCIPAVPEEPCVENLTVSRCPAPISQLSNCVAQFWSSVESGCVPDGVCSLFHHTDGCSDTIITEFTEDFGCECSVNVEPIQGTHVQGECMEPK
jgi:hypothetical protein